MLDCNTYLVRGKLTAVVDPGFGQYLPPLIDGLRQDGIKPEDIDIIVNTHLHIDHCLADEALKEASGAKILLHTLQKEFYPVSVETSRFFGLEPLSFKEDGYLDDKLDLGNSVLEIIPAPGHSPDSICFYSREAKFLICGDVLFDRNTGRVDLPGGNRDHLKQSIERISQLEIEHLLPGHMGMVSGADKVKNNFDFVRKHVFPWL